MLIGCVVPRPIAWVVHDRRRRLRNLAPFSFQGVCGDPPTSPLSRARARAGARHGGTPRRAAGEFVVNVVDDDHAEAMNARRASTAEVESRGGRTGGGARRARQGAARGDGAHQSRVPRRPYRQIATARTASSSARSSNMKRPRRSLRRKDRPRRRRRAAAGGAARRAHYSHTHDLFEMKRPKPDYGLDAGLGSGVTAAFFDEGDVFRRAPGEAALPRAFVASTTTSLRVSPTNRREETEPPPRRPHARSRARGERGEIGHRLQSGLDDVLVALDQLAVAERLWQLRGRRLVADAQDGRRRLHDVAPLGVRARRVGMRARQAVRGWASRGRARWRPETLRCCAR